MSAVNVEEMDRARIAGSAGVHEAAGKIGALPFAIQAVDPLGMTVAGPAFPVRSSGGSNIWIHRAIVAASPGDVLVIATDGFREAGHWGEILTAAARARGIAGVVIDGGVRDRRRIVEIGFPVFAASVSLAGTSKEPGSTASLPGSVTIGQVEIRRGDLIVGDGDGVAAIPHERWETVLASAEERQRREASILERIAQGETTLTIYGLTE